MRSTTRGLLAVIAVIGLGTLPAWAAPVDYVRVCDAYGADYFYMPGTDICMNANTGTTKQATAGGTYNGESEMAARFNDAFEGVAVSAAMPQAYIPPGHRFAIAGNWAQFTGSSGSAGFSYGAYGAPSAGALGIGAAMRINDNLTFSAAGAIGLDRSTWATRVGFNMSW